MSTKKESKSTKKDEVVETPEVETMPTNGKEKRVQIAVSVPESVSDALTQIFFDGRGTFKNRNDVVRHAFTTYIENNATVGNETTNDNV